MTQEKAFRPDEDDIEVVMGYADHYDECPLFNYAFWLSDGGLPDGMGKAQQIYTERAITSVINILRKIKDSK